LTLRHLWNVFRRIVPKRSALQDYLVVFKSASHELEMRMTADNITAVFTQEAEGTSEELLLPLDALKHLQGSGTFAMVHLEAAQDGKVEARWEEGGIPQVASYAVKAKPVPLPPLPDNWQANAKLLQALQEAAQSASKDRIRFATDCIQLCGKSGSIVASDGRQLLVQNGFVFPWQEDLLVPASQVFAAHELESAEVPQVGSTPEHVVLSLGHWKLLLNIDKASHFPNTQAIVQKAQGNDIHLQLAAEDASFLARTIPCLPGHDEEAQTLTLDLNGHVCVRAKAEATPQVTELTLSRSSYTGKPARVCMVRRMLTRALELGIADFRLAEPGDPIYCQSDNKTFIFTTNPPSTALAPAEDSIRVDSAGAVACPAKASRLPAVESVHAEATSMAISPIKPQRRAPIMQETAITPTPVTMRTVKKRQRSEPSEGVLSEALALRDQLREDYRKASSLIRALKQQRRQSKLMQTTLASLKQLQAIGG